MPRSNNLKEAVFRGMTLAITHPSKDRADVVYEEVKAAVERELETSHGLVKTKEESGALKALHAGLLTDRVS